MTEKLYLIDTKWRLGEIEEAEVIKETEKTYTIKRTSWGAHLVRKSEMRVWDYVLCKSYDEAVEKTKELLNLRIMQYTGKIESLKADIEKYKAMLAEFEKGGEADV